MRAGSGGGDRVPVATPTTAARRGGSLPRMGSSISVVM